jgi:signal transduction histidine kinase
MSTGAASAPGQSVSVMRDPVLVLPLAVGAGLAVGWEGLHNGISGGRVAVDLALCWGFVAASLVALQRSRWRRSRLLLALAGIALLAGDLQWFSASGLWVLGLALQWVWLAVIIQLVLTFPDGRSWSPLAGATVIGAYLAAAAGGLVAVLVSTDARDGLSVLASQSASDAVGRARAGLGFAVALVTLVLVGWRLASLRGAARRARAPLLIGAALALPVMAVTLAEQTLTNQGSAADTIARALTGLIPLGFLAGIGWSRIRRTSATDLVVELRSTGALTLRDRLARTLGDSTLQLAYRLDDGRYVDESGEAAIVPDRPERAVTLLTARDEVLAALVHDPALLDEPALVESVRATAGLVLENERLAAEVRAQLAQVRASRTRLLTATDEERRRIERDLHDGAQQQLVAVCVALGTAAGHTQGPTRQALLSAQDQLEQAIAELRQLARGIHPTLLREDGLDAALDGLARRTPIPVHVEGAIDARLAPAIELAAYFVVCEALTNVVKHANATAATIRVAQIGAVLSLSVTDDGDGGVHSAIGGGLAGLRDRVEALDGTLSASNNPHGGTTIRAEIPCAS